MIYSRLIYVLIVLISLLFFTQCAIPEAEDVDPPVVVIIYPYTGSIISGNVLVSIESTDENRIEQVWYYLDGVLIEKSSSASPKFDLNTTPYADDLIHTITAAARDKDGNIGYSTQVLVTISDSDDLIPPTVQILNPLNGQVVHDSVLVLASASDDRIVQSVAFFVDGDSVYADPVYPYQYLWPVIDIADSNEHTVFAKAFDGSNNWAISGRVTVTVFPSLDRIIPTALLVYPLPGQVLSGIILVQVDASDDKQLDRVEFFVDGTQVRTVDAESVTGLFTYSWNTNIYAPNSQHTLYFKAYDRAGNQSVGTPVTFTIGSQDTEPPIINLMYPAPGDTISGIVTVVADVYDNYEVSSVDFFIDGGVNGQPNQTLAIPPWIYTWNTAPFADNRQHTVFVRARDSSGNIATNGPNIFIVQ